LKEGESTDVKERSKELGKLKTNWTVKLTKPKVYVYVEGVDV